VFDRADADADNLLQIGRQRRIVGVTYSTDKRHTLFFDQGVSQIHTALSKALKGAGVRIVDTDLDEQRLLIHSGSDTDPGVYYLFDRKTHELATFLVDRAELEGVKLASVQSVTYPAEDGTTIQAYLTLPPGHESAKGLPAIVMPHGAVYRDVWGFEWLPQYFAARGYAVLQPNFRTVGGFDGGWVEDNVFRSWSTVTGDVLAGGRWLVKEGGADPAKLAIVGWSTGGYAALQSAVVDPTVFKAVIAVAPITDLVAYKDEWREWNNYKLVKNEIGNGPEMHAGSPIEHTDRIKVPVLLFHGELDRAVRVEQSKRMAAKLTSIGGHCELVTWDALDDRLEDSKAREQLLRKSDEFLRSAFGQ
jgi:dipeptidyl aminopeptidase/acylaminoacyl peptidase